MLLPAEVAEVADVAAEVGAAHAEVAAAHDRRRVQQ
jgi:hypothetical protein